MSNSQKMKYSWSNVLFKKKMKRYGIHSSMEQDIHNGNKLYLVYRFYIKRAYLIPLDEYLSQVSKPSIIDELKNIPVRVTPAVIHYDLGNYHDGCLSVNLRVPIMPNMDLQFFNQSSVKLREVISKYISKLNRDVEMECSLDKDLYSKFDKLKSKARLSRQSRKKLTDNSGLTAQSATTIGNYLKKKKKV